jgi:hypothetical protein
MRPTTGDNRQLIGINRLFSTGIDARSTPGDTRQFVGANCLSSTGIGARPDPGDLLSFANGLSSHHQRKGKTGRKRGKGTNKAQKLF